MFHQEFVIKNNSVVEKMKLQYPNLVMKNGYCVEKNKNKFEILRILHNFHFSFKDEYKDKWFETISNCLSKDVPFECNTNGKKTKQTKFKFDIATMSYQIDNIKCKYIKDDILTIVRIYPNEKEIKIFEQLFVLHTQNITDCEFFEIDEENKKYLKFFCSFTDKISYYDNNIKVDYLENCSYGIGKFIFTFFLREEFDSNDENIKNKLRIRLVAGYFVKI